MKNSKGFFSIEIIAAFGVFLMIVITLVPLIYQLKIDQKILSERRYAQTSLQGEMLSFLYTTNKYNITYTVESKPDQPSTTYQFHELENVVKGCAIWTNAKEVQETFCLYGKR